MVVSGFPTSLTKEEIIKIANDNVSVIKSSDYAKPSNTANTSQAREPRMYINDFTYDRTYGNYFEFPTYYGNMDNKQWKNTYLKYANVPLYSFKNGNVDLSKVSIEDFNFTISPIPTRYRFDNSNINRNTGSSSGSTSNEDVIGDLYILPEVVRSDVNNLTIDGWNNSGSSYWTPKIYISNNFRYPVKITDKTSSEVVATSSGISAKIPYFLGIRYIQFRSSYGSTYGNECTYINPDGGVNQDISKIIGDDLIGSAITAKTYNNAKSQSNIDNFVSTYVQNPTPLYFKVEGTIKYMEYK